MGASLTASRVVRPPSLKEIVEKLKENVANLQKYVTSLKEVVIDEEKDEKFGPTVNNLATLFQNDEIELQTKIRSANAILGKPYFRAFVHLENAITKLKSIPNVGKIRFMWLPFLRAMRQGSDAHAFFVFATKNNKKVAFWKDIGKIQDATGKIEILLEMLQKDEFETWKKNNNELLQKIYFIKALHEFTARMKDEETLDSDTANRKIQTYKQIAREMEPLFPIRHSWTDGEWWDRDAVEDSIESAQNDQESFGLFYQCLMFTLQNLKGLDTLKTIVQTPLDLSAEQERVLRMWMVASKKFDEETSIQAQFLAYVDQVEAEGTVSEG